MNEIAIGLSPWTFVAAILLGPEQKEWRVPRVNLPRPPRVGSHLPPHEPVHLNELGGLLVKQTQPNAASLHLLLQLPDLPALGLASIEIGGDLSLESLWRYLVDDHACAKRAQRGLHRVLAQLHLETTLPLDAPPV